MLILPWHLAKVNNRARVRYASRKLLNIEERGRGAPLCVYVHYRKFIAFGTDGGYVGD